MFAEAIFTVIVGLLAFAATNLDDLVLLIAYLAAGRLTRQSATGGQLLGTAVLMAVSAAAALGTVLIPPEWYHWLGLLLIAVGIRQVVQSVRRWRAGALELQVPRTHAPASARRGSAFLALMVVANGGDNLGVYTTLLAANRLEMGVLLIAMTLGLAVLWVRLAAAIVAHPTLGAPVRRAAPWVLPWVLIGLGLLILIPR